MVTFLRLFTNRKSFQSRSRSLEREETGARWLCSALATSCSLMYATRTYFMSFWTWSCRCWGRCGPPLLGAVARKLSR